jgi:uncharacterized protein
MNTLDPAAPFVLDAKPMRRRAGAMLTVQREAPAPAGWAVSSCRVEPGSPVGLDLRLESVVEGVLVSGTANVATVGECSRCLDPVAGRLEIDVQQLFEYPESEQGSGADEEPLPRLVGELLDLEPTLRDGVVLDLPLVPLCGPQCPGLCATCGARLADDPEHRHAQADARWAALQDWSATSQDSPAATADGSDLAEKGN